MEEIKQHGISIIGSGNVATNLANALISNGFQINEIYSRDINRATNLCNTISNGRSTNSLNFANSNSTIFIVAIKDDGIEALSREIKLPHPSYLFHTSGAIGKESLTSSGVDYGVFYPLQTFAEDTTLDFTSIPILIDGNTLQTNELLFELGESLSDHVEHATEKDRQKLHIAAVFASNFTNRMLAASEEFLQSSSLDFEILKPLVQRSVANVFKMGADASLTGPAKRTDTKTIEKHLEIIKNNSYLRSIYYQISNKIIDQFRKKE